MTDSQAPLLRPQTTVILAISADGKIADYRRSPARFGSAADKAHLEQQIAQVDGVLLGAGTLRAYGTTLRVSSLALIEQRHQQGKPSQPIQIVCSLSGDLDPQLPFFRQPVLRWLITTSSGARKWLHSNQFERILTLDDLQTGLNWPSVLHQLHQAGLEHLAILGGGTLVAALLEADAIDQIWLTVCPLLLGGATAPTAIAGTGFLAECAPRLELLSVEAIAQEVFLHYRLQR